MALALAICAGLVLGIVNLGIPGTVGQASQDLPGAMAHAPLGQATLGDFVWNDIDQNGLQNPNEPGINGVLVKLYEDDGDGIFEPTSDPLLGDRVTGDNPNTPIVETGWYQFLIYNTEVLYWVVIDDSNFAPGGPLAGYVLTSANTFGASPMLVFLSGVQDYSDADFGYVSTGVVNTATPTPTPTATLTNTPTSTPTQSPRRRQPKPQQQDLHLRRPKPQRLDLRRRRPKPQHRRRRTPRHRRRSTRRHRRRPTRQCRRGRTLRRRRRPKPRLRDPHRPQPIRRGRDISISPSSSDLRQRQRRRRRQRGHRHRR